MTTALDGSPLPRGIARHASLAPILASGLAFLVLFWTPLTTLARDWWTDPDAGHGLLLAPLALVLLWRRGAVPGRDHVLR